MRRRLLLVLCVLGALAFASVAGGGGGGAKYKLKLNGAAAACGLSCAQSIVIKRLDDDHHSCRPFVDFSRCKWTARTGTKIVLDTYAEPPLTVHTWFGDCSGNGKCSVVMDSNKFIILSWS
jgi:hypothetical protein